jgi:hypothetical protein
MKNSSRILITALFLLTTLLTTSAFALSGIPDLELSTAVSNGGSIYICPAGDGQTLAGAGATITVTLIDGIGAPIANFPFEDLWVESLEPGALVFCPGGNLADANTNASGETTFSGTLIGGGCTQGGLVVYVSGAALVGPPLEIEVNSPDINGDLVVDYCDSILFTQAFLGAYTFCADFNHDGIINISDILGFTPHFCSICQGASVPVAVESGEIGIFFDTAGTQTGILGLTPDTVFDFYVVATSAPGNIRSYQFGITLDTGSVSVVAKNVMPAGSYDFAESDPYNAVVTPLGGCLPVAGPTVLTHFQAMILTTVADSPICLGPPNQALCNFNPQEASYLSCENDCDWRQFYPAYQGCAYVNGMGPVVSESTTWGGLKALYRN